MMRSPLRVPIGQGPQMAPTPNNINTSATEWNLIPFMIQRHRTVTQRKLRKKNNPHYTEQPNIHASSSAAKE